MLARPGRRLSPQLAVVLAAAAAAALVQSFLLFLDCDVSWLITVNEKMLAGQRLYVDVIEANPPASIWMYSPSVFFAEALGLKPEAIVAAAFIAGAIASCALTLRVSARLRHPPNPLVLATVVSFVELILPLGTFAQREHAALLLAIPTLAALAVLAEGRPLSQISRLFAGIAAGLVVAIKPHFALVMMPAFAFAWWQGRSLKPILPVATAGFAAVAVYVAAIFAFTPEYLRLVPVLADVYLPLGERWSTLLRGPVVVVPLAIYGLVLALRPRRISAISAIFLIGSLGFAVAALIQGRGYLNHALPGMALGFAGLILVAAESTVAWARRRFVLTAAAVLACLELYAMASIRPLPGLAQTVEDVARPRPGVITLGPELLTGHPLVRNIGGHWVGSRPSLFIAAGAHHQLASAYGQARNRMLHWYKADLGAFAKDVRRGHPDVILVDAKPSLAWLRNAPEIQGVMADYRPRARVEDIEIWVRR